MALNLKTKKKCHIVAPYWLNVGKVTYLFLFASYSLSPDHLQDRLNRETSEPGFSDLPFHFTEVSKVLLDVYVTPPSSDAGSPDMLHFSASDDLENSDKLRSLLKDLREARQAKSREGLKTLDHSELSVCSTKFQPYSPANFKLSAPESVFNGDQRNSTLLRSVHESHDTAVSRTINICGINSLNPYSIDYIYISRCNRTWSTICYPPSPIDLSTINPQTYNDIYVGNDDYQAYQ